MSYLRYLLIVSLIIVLGCGQNGIDSHEQIGVFGFKLGQKIDLSDATSMASLGLSEVEKNSDTGAISCKFRLATPCRKFENGTLTIDPDSHKIYIISSIIDGEEFEITKETDLLAEAMKLKYGGKWKLVEDGYGGCRYEGILPGECSAGIFFSDRGDHCSCHAVLRDDKVLKQINSRSVLKKTESFF